MMLYPDIWAHTNPLATSLCPSSPPILWIRIHPLHICFKLPFGRKWVGYVFILLSILFSSFFPKPHPETVPVVPVVPVLHLIQHLLPWNSQPGELRRATLSKAPNSGHRWPCRPCRPCRPGPACCQIHLSPIGAVARVLPTLEYVLGQTKKKLKGPWPANQRPDMLSYVEPPSINIENVIKCVCVWVTLGMCTCTRICKCILLCMHV